jgi:hypothetical protein
VQKMLSWGSEGEDGRGLAYKVAGASRSVATGGSVISPFYSRSVSRYIHQEEVSVHT